MWALPLPLLLTFPFAWGIVLHGILYPVQSLHSDVPVSLGLDTVSADNLLHVNARWLPSSSPMSGPSALARCRTRPTHPTRRRQ